MASPRRLIGLSLLAAALIQSAALATMVYDRVTLLREGREVTLTLQQYDPRSLLQGYYSRLNYDIARVPSDLLAKDELPADDKARGGTHDVYVVLKPDAAGDYRPVSAHLTPPSPAEGAVTVRGTTRYLGGKTLAVTYGIESFYLPKEQAAALDLKDRDTLRVIAAVGPDGEMAVKRLLVNGKVAYEEPPY